MTILFTILLICTAVKVGAQTADKQSYTLFRRTPTILMREDMETDRPDVTESPYTVDAGHIQYESDLIRYKVSNNGGNISRQYLLNPFTLKFGLTRLVDFQVNLETYRIEYHKEEADQETHYRNCGSLSFRVKCNMLGNDKGKFALAAMPYIKLPANSFFEHHRMEGGLIIPAQLKILDKLDLGFQEEVDLVAEEEDYEVQGLQSVTVSYDILDQIKVIGETYYVYHFGEHKLENYFNCALQFFPIKNFAIDGGTIQGIQKGTEHHYYLGIAWRW
jgi:hypothetical protein